MKLYTVSLKTVTNNDAHAIHFPLVLFDRQRYTGTCGADIVRCVGATITCAGVGELALSHTAVFYFPVYIVARKY